MVGNKGSSLTHWLRSACSRIDCGLQFEFSIHLRAEENNVEGDVQLKQEDDDRSQRAIGFVVVGKMRHIE